MKYKKYLSIFIVVSILISMLPLKVYALDSITITPDSYKSGELTVTWNSINEDISFVKVFEKYNADTDTDDGKIYEDSISDYELTLKDIEFENDKIYELHFKFYDADNNYINKGFMYFMPQMTFEAKPIEQNATTLDGGGKINGINPKLNINWNIPKIWNGETDDDGKIWIYADKEEAYTKIKQNLNIYYDEISLTKLDFIINISNGTNKLTSIIVNNEDGKYSARLDNNDNKIDIRDMDEDGIVGFDLGGTDENISANELLDDELLPGTVYYLTIKPIFRNSNGDQDIYLHIGSPDKYNSSPLAGDVQYTYTPVKYQLTKDSGGIVYVKIFKLNTGNTEKLYYKIETSDVKTLSGKWTPEKTINSSMFSGDYTIALLSNIPIDNNVFYRISIISENKGGFLSDIIEYRIADDTSRPPVPTDITLVSRKFNTDDKKITDITLAWKKPINWDEIKDNENEDDDIVFHILLNTIQKNDTSNKIILDVDGIDKEYYPIYRKVVHVSSKDLDDSNANSLVYVLKGDELFKGKYMDDDWIDTHNTKEENIINSENYPDYLLPNREYYIQMYTTRGVDRNSDDSDKFSDRSATISFTTLDINEREVPVPGGINLLSNEVSVNIDENGAIESIDNEIQLNFNEVSIDWDYLAVGDEEYEIEYDLFMGTEVNNLEKIASTDEDSFVKFNKFEDTKTINATINKYSSTEKLLPNSTYYFAVSTRIIWDKNKDEISSEKSSLITVTTKKGEIENSNDDEIIPKAPDDFIISKDSSGNNLVSGTSATVEWSNNEDNVKYEFIITSNYINADTEEYVYKDDLTYINFLEVYGENIIIKEDDEKEGLTYNENEEKFQLEIDKLLFPNKVYYFSVRAINNELEENKSSWISIPITTQAVGEHQNLDVIYSTDIRFNWSDADQSFKNDDYNVLISESNGVYTLANRNDVSIIKDGNIFYGKVTNLEDDKEYGVKVYRGDDESDIIYENQSIITKDRLSQIEVKWDGNDYFDYEIAVRSVVNNEYTTLENVDYSVYKDKTESMIGTDLYKYIVKIDYVETKMTDGSYEHMPLKSNMKYYIKLRVVKTDPINPTLISYSKYVGPVKIKTEFSQTDYNRSVFEEEKINKFNNLLKNVERLEYWKANISNGNTYKYFLKRDKILNEIDDEKNYSYKIDLKDKDIDTKKYEIYFPVEILKYFNDSKIGLEIGTNNSCLTLRPDSINEKKNNLIVSDKLNNNSDKFIKLIIEKKDFDKNNLPKNYVSSSSDNGINVEVFGTENDYLEYEILLNNGINTSDTGISDLYKVSMLNIIKNTKTENLDKVDDFIDSMFKGYQNEIGIFLESKVLKSIESGKKEEDIIKFDKPAILKLCYENNIGKEFSYIKYGDLNSWNIVKNKAIYVNGDITFNITKGGNYAVISRNDIENQGTFNINSQEIINYKKLLELYDLYDVFNTSYYKEPEKQLNISELINIYEKINNLNESGDVRNKIKTYGLDRYIEPSIDKTNGVKREEAAYIMTKIYADKLGIDVNNVRSKTYIDLDDELDIKERYYYSILWCVDMDVLELYKNKVLPKSYIKRSEMIYGLNKVLKLTGELN
ncbi:MAG: hypothetical protein ABF289_16740 [Clostridiales bacterium]